jgi:hypothetical protein
MELGGIEIYTNGVWCETFNVRNLKRKNIETFWEKLY